MWALLIVLATGRVILSPYIYDGEDECRIAKFSLVEQAQPGSIKAAICHRLKEA